MNDNDQASSPNPSRNEPATGGDYEAALETVGQVIAWYSARILAERRSGAPDAQLLEKLMSKRQACLEDQERLEGASGEETARIAAAYEALLDELESAEG
ncbi:hypothetical protein [Streptomyces chryseus]|uniref:hypothetical protein n=1 Tax=Streptomyces chryseus TaxID=68186 RepID=UPI00110FD8B9|nr:hypothetical protein [Streptomyces chryseus]